MKESFRECGVDFKNRHWTFINLRFAGCRSVPRAGPRQGRLRPTEHGRIRLYMNSFCRSD